MKRRREKTREEGEGLRERERGQRPAISLKKQKKKINVTGGAFKDFSKSGRWLQVNSDQKLYDWLNAPPVIDFSKIFQSRARVTPSF